MSLSAVDIQIVSATRAHIRPIAQRMRQADRDEVFAASGKSPAAALAYSMRKSAASWTALIDGRPEIMFGVGNVNILAGVGAPWLLGTNAVDTHFVAFLRRSVDWRDQLFKSYPTMRNFVDANNATAIRWLHWLGATLSDPVVFRGHQFRMFELRSDDV